MMRDFQDVDCSLCGSSQYERILSGPDRLVGTPGMFHFVRCLNCGLIRQNPRPPSIVETCYPEGYPPFAAPVADAGSIWQRLDRGWGQKKRARIVRRYRSGGRLLDVGCATGGFLLEMRKEPSWEVMGIEPVGHACHKARELGLNVACSTLAEAGLADSTLDAVTLWYVLEHMVDPVAELREVRRVLRPDGLLIFCVPVWESRLRRWFGPYWVEWDLPRHMHIFSDQTVHRLLEKTGFRGVGRLTPFGEHRVFRMSAMNWAKRRIRSARMREVLGTCLASPLARAALFLPMCAIAWRDSASVAVYAARKEPI